MLNILIKIWTVIEIVMFLEWRRQQKEKQEEQTCDVCTQETQKNTSDTP